MDGLTQKERVDLESVFAVIYTKKENKFVQFYKEFYSVAMINFLAVKNKILKKKSKINK